MKKVQALTPKQKKVLKLEGLFAPRSALEFAGFAIVTTMVSQLAAGNPLAYIFVVALFGGWWWLDRQRMKKLPDTVGIIVAPEAPAPARGLILLLSPYSPQNPVLKNLDTLNPLVEIIVTTPHEQLQESDFLNIDLFNSNLVPQIKSAKYHLEAGKLRDIWLISSESYEVEKAGVSVTIKGSEETAIILEKYLRFQYGERVDIYRENLCVKQWDYRKLWEIGEGIFQSSGYQNEVIVADITGGTKLMSVALAMACIPPKRRMQYMDSQRDWEGNPLPKGEMSPVVIDVDPILYQSSEE